MGSKCWIKSSYCDQWWGSKVSGLIIIVGSKLEEVYLIVMDLNAKTPTHSYARGLYAFWRLRSSADLFTFCCLTYENGEYRIVGLSYLYIDKSQRVTLARGFFANKPTSTNPIISIICGDRSNHTLSGIIFYGRRPTWSNVGPVACKPHTISYRLVDR